MCLSINETENHDCSSPCKGKLRQKVVAAIIQPRLRIRPRLETMRSPVAPSCTEINLAFQLTNDCRLPQSVRIT